MNAVVLSVVILVSGCFATAKQPDTMVLIPGGEYLPFLESDVVKINQSDTLKALEGEPQNQKDVLKSKTLRQPTHVESFWLDIFPVTIADYVSFLKKNPQWQKTQIKKIFADSHYLESWSGDLKPPSPGNSPVTHVSWFAATAYCEAQGKSLPTLDQWEYAAYDQGRNQETIKEKILEWYGKPNQPKIESVGKAPKNGFGVAGLHGLIWEWTFDFSNLMISSEGRSANAKETGLFCGAGSLNALDSLDYAAFMRFSFRNSLKGNYTTANLGFRCAKEVRK